MQRVHLHVIVSDYDRVGSNERIGQVIIGSQATGAGLKHWTEMLATPRRSVAQWHTLQRKPNQQFHIIFCFFSVQRRLIQIVRLFDGKVLGKLERHTKIFV